MEIRKHILKILLIIVILIFSSIITNRVYAEEKTDNSMKIYMSRVIEDGAYYISSSEDKTQIQLWEENQSLSQCFEI